MKTYRNRILRVKTNKPLNCSQSTAHAHQHYLYRTVFPQNKLSQHIYTKKERGHHRKYYALLMVLFDVYKALTYPR